MRLRKLDRPLEKSRKTEITQFSPNSAIESGWINELGRKNWTHRNRNNVQETKLEVIKLKMNKFYCLNIKLMYSKYMTNIVNKQQQSKRSARETFGNTWYWKMSNFLIRKSSLNSKGSGTWNLCQKIKRFLNIWKDSISQ